MQQQIQAARDSLSRCIQSPAFLDRFYDLFIESSPDIAQKFANVDMPRLKKVLQDSLFVMLVAAGTETGFAHKELEKLAERHSRRQLGIDPAWYDLWLRSLMKTVAEQDPEYRPELEDAWRASLKPGIELMKSRY
jgi:hemoglobin-like flavoprotein